METMGSFHGIDSTIDNSQANDCASAAFNLALGCFAFPDFVAAREKGPVKVQATHVYQTHECTAWVW